MHCFNKIFVIEITLLYLSSFTSLGQTIVKNSSEEYQYDTFRNPSAMQYYSMNKKGEVAFFHHISSVPSELDFQEGEQIIQSGFTTSQVISTSSLTYWGEASYLFERRKNKQGSLLASPSRLGPYQVTDTIGGDQYQERYHIKGGMAKNIKQFTLGIEGGYVLSSSYQRTDPRPNNTLTDLNIGVSAAYTFDDKIQVGATTHYGRYKQDCNIKNFTPTRDDKFFSVNGLGTYDQPHTKIEGYYYRNYQGNFTQYDLFFHTLHRNPLFGNIRLYKEKIDVSSRIAITPYSYATNTYKLELGYIVSQGKLRWRNIIHLSASENRGTERIYEYTVIDKENNTWDYVFLSESEKYQSSRYYAGINSQLRIEQNLHRWFIDATLGIEQNKIERLYPKDLLQQKYLLPRIHFKREYDKSQWQWSWSLGGQWRKVLSKESQISPIPNRIPTYLERTQKKVEADYGLYTLHLMYGHKIKNNKLLFLELTPSLWYTTEVYHNMNITLGLKL